MVCKSADLFYNRPLEITQQEVYALPAIESVLNVIAFLSEQNFNMNRLEQYLSAREIHATVNIKDERTSGKSTQLITMFTCSS